MVIETYPEAVGYAQALYLGGCITPVPMLLGLMGSQCCGGGVGA